MIISPTPAPRNAHASKNIFSETAGCLPFGPPLEKETGAPTSQFCSSGIFLKILSLAYSPLLYANVNHWIKYVWMFFFDAWFGAAMCVRWLERGHMHLPGPPHELFYCSCCMWPSCWPRGDKAICARTVPPTPGLIIYFYSANKSKIMSKTDITYQVAWMMFFILLRNILL